MRLTDSTEIKLLASTRYLAIYEFAGTKRVSEAARIVSIVSPDVFKCGWLVSEGYTEDGDQIIRECGATAVGFDNGWKCLNGHDHYTYGGSDHAEYFDEDEMEAARQGHFSLPANARTM